MACDVLNALHKILLDDLIQVSIGDSMLHMATVKSKSMVYIWVAGNVVTFSYPICRKQETIYPDEDGGLDLDDPDFVSKFLATAKRRRRQ